MIFLLLLFLIEIFNLYSIFDINHIKLRIFELNFSPPFISKSTIKLNELMRF